MCAPGGGKLSWYIDSDVSQEGNDVARPADGNRDGSDGVFEDEIPSDDPSEEFPQCGVAVRVSTARHRNKRRELAVAQGGES